MKATKIPLFVETDAADHASPFADDGLTVYCVVRPVHSA